jgi:TRAP-type C4-dicarboxylate transport system substrate-binding protein
MKTPANDEMTLSARRQTRPAGVLRRSLAIMAVAGLALAATHASAQQKTTLTYRYATAFGANDEPYQTAAEWIKRVTDKVAKDTNYVLRITVHRDGSLLKLGETLAGIQDGRVDMGLIPPAVFPSQFPLSQAVSIPFQSDDAFATLHANADLARTNPALMNEWSKLGVVPIAFGVAQNTATSAKLPIKTLADLQGKRVRAIGYHADALRAVGASPVAIPTSEVYQALQTGVIDAFSGSPMGNQITATRAHEVAKNFVDLGLGQYTSVASVAVRKSVWDRIPAEVQKIMLAEGAAVAEEFIPSNLSRLDKLACETLKAAGGAVVRLPEAQIAEWKAKTQSAIIDKYVASAAKDSGMDAAGVRGFLVSYQDALKKHTGKSKYVDGMTACREAR